MAVALRANLTASGDDEQALVAAVRRGDDRAFEQLYSRYRPRIGAFVQGMVGDHGRAEDIAQDVFISALRRLRATDQPVLFKPWLYEIAKNACIDEYRRARRAREVPLQGGEDGEDASNLRSLRPTPDAAIESKQQLDHLRWAFRGLSESHHRILVLRELEGLSYNQIGDRMGISKPVVESTLFRARRRLGEEYAEIESGRRCARVQDLIVVLGERPVRSLGLRDRRLLTRHLPDCPGCRRQAWAAGIEYAEGSRARRLAAGAMAAVPFLRVRVSQSPRAVTAGATHVAGTARALGPLAPLVGSGGSLSGLGRAATAAVLAIAGTGGGIVAGGYESSSSSAAPPAVRVVSARMPAFARAPATGGSVFITSPFSTSQGARPLAGTPVARSPRGSTAGTPSAGAPIPPSPAWPLVGAAIPAGAGSGSGDQAGLGGDTPVLDSGAGAPGQTRSPAPSLPPILAQAPPGGTGTVQPTGGSVDVQPTGGGIDVQPTGGGATAQPIGGGATPQPTGGTGSPPPASVPPNADPGSGTGPTAPPPAGTGPGIGHAGGAGAGQGAPGTDAPGHGTTKGGGGAGGQDGQGGGAGSQDDASGQSGSAGTKSHQPPHGEGAAAGNQARPAPPPAAPASSVQADA